MRYRYRAIRIRLTLPAWASGQGVGVVQARYLRCGTYIGVHNAQRSTSTALWVTPTKTKHTHIYEGRETKVVFFNLSADATAVRTLKPRHARGPVRGGEKVYIHRGSSAGDRGGCARTKFPMGTLLKQDW